jgi:hypothetical protein
LGGGKKQWGTGAKLPAISIRRVEMRADLARMAYIDDFGEKTEFINGLWIGAFPGRKYTVHFDNG